MSRNVSPLVPLSPMSAPTIEEQLCAAAYRMLTDGRPRPVMTRLWAMDVLERAAPGPTTFLTHAIRHFTTPTQEENHARF